MPNGLVDDILREIEALSEEERLALDRQLAERLAQQWRQETGLARDEALRRGSGGDRPGD